MRQEAAEGLPSVALLGASAASTESKRGLSTVISRLWSLPHRCRCSDRCDVEIDAHVHDLQVILAVRANLVALVLENGGLLARSNICPKAQTSRGSAERRRAGDK